jgi:putative protease
MAKEKELGKITHYFDKISVAIVELSGAIQQGDKLHVKGHTTDFEVDADSIQIEKTNVENAKAGEVIGLKVPEEVREGDKVYKKE